VPRKGNNISIYSLPLHFGKTITGSHGGETKPEVDIPRYLRLAQSGKLALDPLITDRVGLDELNDAIARMRSGEVVGRCVIDMRR
jgi:S-(hydroxymethyl)glutathione dehydrogenase / alcohol dehydrogenase